MKEENAERIFSLVQEKKALEELLERLISSEQNSAVCQLSIVAPKVPPEDIRIPHGNIRKILFDVSCDAVRHRLHEVKTALDQL